MYVKSGFVQVYRVMCESTGLFSRSREKNGGGGFCVLNVYAAICVELCFDGNADFRIILWLYLEYHPPLHF